LQEPIARTALGAARFCWLRGWNLCFLGSGHADWISPKTRYTEGVLTSRRYRMRRCLSASLCSSRTVPRFKTHTADAIGRTRPIPGVL
jgi:hypothetical protein